MVPVIWIMDDNNNKDQSHLALGDIAMNVLYEGSLMGSAMVPLDKALAPTVAAAMRDDVVAGGNMRLFAQSKCQILTGDSDPQISTCRGGPGPLSNTMLLGTTLVSLPNGISFRPSVIAGFMSLR